MAKTKVSLEELNREIRSVRMFVILFSLVILAGGVSTGWMLGDMMSNSSNANGSAVGRLYILPLTSLVFTLFGVLYLCVVLLRGFGNLQVRRYAASLEEMEEVEE